MLSAATPLLSISGYIASRQRSMLLGSRLITLTDTSLAQHPAYRLA